MEPQGRCKQPYSECIATYIGNKQEGAARQHIPVKWLQIVVWPAPKVNTVKSLRRALRKLVYRYLDSCHMNIDRPTLQMQRSAASTLFTVQIKLTQLGHKPEETPRGRTRCSTLNICLTCVLLLSLYYGHCRQISNFVHVGLSQTR